ncbi:hypothetical protein EMIT051CA3_90204 [Pseudomonas chlororaphis]
MLSGTPVVRDGLDVLAENAAHILGLWFEQLAVAAVRGRPRREQVAIKRAAHCLLRHGVVLAPQAPNHRQNHFNFRWLGRSKNAQCVDDADLVRLGQRGCRGRGQGVAGQ